MKTVTKIAALVLSMIFVLQISVFAQTADDVYAYYSQEKEAIIVEGASPYGEGTAATVNISKNNALFYFNFAQTGEDGNFEFVCSMDAENDESGTYSITVGGAALDAFQYADGVVFVNAEDSERILGEIKNSTVDTIEGVIKADENIGLIDVDVNGDILSLTDGSVVFSALAGKEFDNVPAVRSAFDAAVAIQFFNENSADQCEALLEKYSDNIGIDTELLFNNIKTNDLKADVYNTVTSKNIELTAEAFCAEFDKACYTALFNGFTSSDRDDFIPYLEACNDANYTEANLSDYDKLSDADQVNLVKNVIKFKNTNKFDDLKDVESVFNKELKDMIEPEEEEEEDEGGRVITIGGGGGGGGGNKAPDEKPAEEPETEKKEESETEENKTRFIDLETVPWAKKEIEALAEKGVIDGVGNNKFNPGGYVTREEFIKLAVIGFNLPIEETKNTFTDVNENDWFYKPVMNAYALGIINGVDFDTFGTGSKITREQLCTIVYRAMLTLDVQIEVEDMAVEIADKEKISDYAIDAVEAMYRAGIVSGVGNGNFAPDMYATRAQAAKIIYEVIERIG